MDELGEIEVQRMKHNAFSVCKEVAGRIDGSVAPNGYMEGYVSSDMDDLFYWATPYLKKYLEMKDHRDLKLPGVHYYTELCNFIKNHIRIGEK